MLELHRGGNQPYQWQETEISLLEVIATQVGVALTQAQAYSNLSQLNHQLEALERSQSNLIAIVGHELRTPLSTIQVCLESLDSEPNMDRDYRQMMLSTALKDSERLRQLVQDFLTLSRLESDHETWQIESIQLQECLDLALSSIFNKQSRSFLPTLIVDLPDQLDWIVTDAEKLILILTKLLENACKFTDAQGQIKIQAKRRNIAHSKSQQKPMLEIMIADTGRGIEPSQLEAIFNRFYQEETALRRSQGGTGLGLAICRRMIEGLGGEIWAESKGKNQGSCFHLSVPIDPNKS
jgi:signal transduction histidine kinase